jgi:hypothetical protein
LGLRLDVLSVLAVIGFALMLFFNRIHRDKINSVYFLITIGLIGTVIAISRGDHFDTYQAFRGAVFPIIFFYILNNKINQKFIDNLELSIPIITAGCVISIILYYLFKSDFYNSTLDMPYEDSDYKRIFVYPTYFFLILFCDAVWKNRYSQILYGSIIAVSGSKAIIMTILITYCFVIFRKSSLFDVIRFFFSVVLIISLSYYFGILDRVGDFVVDGDPWRIEEPLAALARLSDPIRLIFGNGFGVPYWEGRAALLHFDEITRGLENSAYDVHNGFLALALKFGVFGTAAFAFSFWKKVRQIPMRWMLLSAVAVNVYLSHGPVQLAEAIGLGLGLALVVERNASHALRNLRPYRRFASSPKKHVP